MSPATVAGDRESESESESDPDDAIILGRTACIDRAGDDPAS
jgi:hypothetical protein